MRKKGNILVTSVCMSVCSLQAKPLDLQTQHLAHTLWTIIISEEFEGQGYKSRSLVSRSKVKAWCHRVGVIVVRWGFFPRLTQGRCDTLVFSFCSNLSCSLLSRGVKVECSVSLLFSKTIQMDMWPGSCGCPGGGKFWVRTIFIFAPPPTRK